MQVEVLLWVRLLKASKDGKTTAGVGGGEWLGMGEGVPARF